MKVEIEEYRSFKVDLEKALELKEVYNEFIKIIKTICFNLITYTKQKNITKLQDYLYDIRDILEEKLSDFIFDNSELIPDEYKEYETHEVKYNENPPKFSELNLYDGTDDEFDKLFASMWDEAPINDAEDTENLDDV